MLRVPDLIKSSGTVKVDAHVHVCVCVKKFWKTMDKNTYDWFFSQY